MGQYDQEVHGSLFAGIGGFDLGFERAGIKTVWQVELDSYCRRVLERHFPDAIRFEDIRDCGKHNLAPVDILSGGFPCQDISNAGKRLGIDGERSGLWREYARIIGELRPRYVVVENVAALLGRGMERVLGDLAACGYDAEWQSIRASDVGAPHRRERIWIVAYPFDRRSQIGRPKNNAKVGRGAEAREAAGDKRAKIEESDSLPNAESVRGPSIFRDEPDGVLSEVLADANGRGLAVQGQSSGRDRFATRGSEDVENSERLRCGTERAADTGEADSDGSFGAFGRSSWWAVEPDVGRVAHGIPARVDRLRGLGNAVVPQIAEWIGRRIVEADERTT